LEGTSPEKERGHNWSEAAMTIAVGAECVYLESHKFDPWQLLEHSSLIPFPFKMIDWLSRIPGLWLIFTQGEAGASKCWNWLQTRAEDHLGSGNTHVFIIKGLRDTADKNRDLFNNYTTLLTTPSHQQKEE
jgi:hypothetical protein